MILRVVLSLGGFLSQVLLTRLTAQAAYELRMTLSRQILASPYRLLEEIGIHRLLATLNDDIPAEKAAGQGCLTKSPDRGVEDSAIVRWGGSRE